MSVNKFISVVWLLYLATIGVINCHEVKEHSQNGNNNQGRQQNLWYMKEPRLQVLEISSGDEKWDQPEIIEKFVHEVQTPTRDLTKILGFRNLTIVLEKSILLMSQTNVTQDLKIAADHIFKDMERINREIRTFEIEDELHYYRFLQESQSRFASLLQTFQKKFEEARAAMESVSNRVKNDFVLLLDTQLQVESNWKNARRLGVILDQDEDYSDNDYADLIHRMQWNAEREDKMVEVMIKIEERFHDIDELIRDLTNKIALEKVEKKNKVFMQEYEEISKKNLEVMKLINENAEFLSGFKVLLDVRLLKLKDNLTETTDKFSQDTTDANDLTVELNKLNEVHSRDVTNIKLRKKYIHRTEI